MKIYQTQEIRNVNLIGGTRSGKTTLAEAMLFEGGVINRRGTVEDKNTVSDYLELELERLSSISATVLYSEHNNHKINFIDTPGLDDFVGEVYCTMKVVETSMLLLNAQNGVEVGTEIVWRTTKNTNKPVCLVINQLDHEKANFEETYRQMQQFFGNKAVIVQYPLNPGTGFNTIIDVLKKKQYVFPKEGGKPQISDIPESEKAKAEDYYNKLIEAAAESVESLMEKFFEEGTLSEAEIRTGLKAGIISRNLFPVLCVAAKHNIGVSTMMDFIVENLPAPNEVAAPKTSSGKEIPCKADGEPQVFVFKTRMEPHLGQLSLFKVTSGTVTEGIDMVNAVSDSKERLSQLFAVAGKNRNKIEKIVAGDIAATIKLKDTYTNHTLNLPKANQEAFDPIALPEPKFRTAVRAKNQADEEKLGSILKKMHNEDPSLLVEQSVELRQTIVQGQGELHLNMVKWMIENIDKIEIEFISPRIPYRETITKNATASYRHKKQSGGAGQFGEVHMLIQPYTEGMTYQNQFPIRGTDVIELNWGGKLVYNSCIVGGVIDARFMPAILKGIMEKIEEGPLTGSYARDIVVNIFDGKMHPVDSNEISFKLAGRNAFKDAFKNAGPKILEPIYDVEVIVPEDRMGDVMTDLQGRRAIIMGMEGEAGYQRIKAKVPLAEMDRYSTTLSSLTSGKATFGMKFDAYQQVPADVQDKLLKAYEQEHKDEE